MKGIGLGLAGIAGLSAPVAAEEDEEGDESTLAEPPGFFAIYSAEGGSADSLDDFGFPFDESGDSPFFAGANDGGEGGLFDGDGIRITPNQKTLHHGLRFFAGLLMERDPKPYVLLHQGDGVYVSRGQTVNFRARSDDEMQAAIVQMIPELAPLELPYEPPLSTLEGEKWRAVATDRMKVDLSGDPPYSSEWANTRVDFYTRGGGKPDHALSLLYMLWADDAALEYDPNEDQFPFPQMDAPVVASATELITGGRLNLGGQQPPKKGPSKSTGGSDEGPASSSSPGRSGRDGPPGGRPPRGPRSGNAH